jgi:protocatechuate 3,4-dioxygenase beta subunit
MRCAVLWILLASAAEAQTYTIAGVVENATGQPQKRVRVALAPSEELENETAIVTGEDGRFRFAGLAAGKYHLTAEPPSGGRQNYGQRTLSQGFGIAVAAGPGLSSESLLFRLIPTAAIRGRVLDAGGEPADGVMVQLFVSTLLRGKRSVLYTGYRWTDDRGEYRFGALRDGGYYVAAVGRPWYATAGVVFEGPLSKMGYITTYYPDTRDPRAAGRIALKPGQEAVADFTLTAVPAATLTVTPKGVQGSVQLNLTFEGVAGTRSFAQVEMAYAPNPAAITGVQPGRYTVRAHYAQSGKSMYGLAKVDVGAGDAAVDVTLAPAPVVTGKLWIEDSGTIPEGAYIELENEAENIHTRRPVAADGTFRFDGMPPGRYRPLAATAHKMIHLHTVTLEGALASEEMVEIAKDAKIELLGLMRGAGVKGDVVRKGQPVAGVLALLAPRKESANPLDYRGFQTDSDGTFEFDGVPPGEYMLIVLEEWADFEYPNPEAVRPLIGGGRAVKVGTEPGEKIRVELK